jgi:hypothetical protein
VTPDPLARRQETLLAVQEDVAAYLRRRKVAKVMYAANAFRRRMAVLSSRRASTSPEPQPNSPPERARSHEPAPEPERPRPRTDHRVKFVRGVKCSA